MIFRCLTVQWLSKTTEVHFFSLQLRYADVMWPLTCQRLTPLETHLQFAQSASTHPQSFFLWLVKRIQEIKMAYENFMCNKDFHPSNIRNLKKVGKFYKAMLSCHFATIKTSKTNTMNLLFVLLLNTCTGADVRGWAASEARGEETGGAEAAIPQGTRSVQIKVRHNLGVGVH